ncbi:anti-sigma-K factor RskA [Arthrobacter tecti]
MQDKDMNKQFADDLRQDLANGLALEWAEMYALDAVSEEERTTLEDYVSGSTPEERESFNERVRAAQETIAKAYAVDEAEPPADLLGRIMSSLPEDRQAQPVHSTPPVPADDLSARREARRKPSSAGRWLVAAAAAVVVAVGGVTVAQNLQPSSVQEEVMQAADVQRNQVPIEGGGTAELAFSTSEDAAVVTLDGVPAPPAGKVYQMWRLPADGAPPESLGTMTAEEVTHKEVPVEGINAYSGLAITVEPEGGSEAPTLPMVVQIPFNA